MAIAERSSSSNPYQSPDPNFPNFIVENNDNRRICELEEYIEKLHNEAAQYDAAVAISIIVLVVLFGIGGFLLGIGLNNY